MTGPDRTTGMKTMNREDKTARVWNNDRPGEPVVLRGHAQMVGCAKWSPDGKLIVTGSDASGTTAEEPPSAW